MFFNQSFSIVDCKHVVNCDLNLAPGKTLWRTFLKKIKISGSSEFKKFGRIFLITRNQLRKLHFNEINIKLFKKNIITY